MYIVTRRFGKEDDFSKWLKLLTGEAVEIDKSQQILYGSAATNTIVCEKVPDKLVGVFDVKKAEAKIDGLLAFGQTLPANERDRFRHYEIPKHSGGMRPIDEPIDALKMYIESLGQVLTKQFFTLYHGRAYAYVRHRSVKDCLEKHINSNWFLKTDFKNFFGSTSLDLMKHILPQIWPYSEFCEDEARAEKLWKALSYVFLDNGLPQGTTISPMLTNLVMIPFDHAMTHNVPKGMVYTRYADDCLLSSPRSFDPRMQVKHMISWLRHLGYPYRINREKTRYGSIKGKNWNLGLMLNGDHKITIGHQAKREFKADLFRFYTDVLRYDYRQRRYMLDKDWIMSFVGRYHYYEYIEPEYVKELTRRTAWKTHRDWHSFDHFVKAGLRRAY